MTGVGNYTAQPFVSDLVWDALNIIMQADEGWLHVTVELKGGCLLTASRLTVRSRHMSTWRATCLSATCWSSSTWTRRQSVDSHLLSHWPEGGSETNKEIIKPDKLQEYSVWCSYTIKWTKSYCFLKSHNKNTNVSFLSVQYLLVWLVCCSYLHWWSCQAGAGLVHSHIRGMLIK